MTGKPELIYVGDPLCSWCWGFSPSFRELRQEHPDRFDYRLVLGGLRAGPAAQKLDAQLRPYLANAWREVEKRTGQPFNHEFLATADFVYDTGPACRAVVTARKLAPERVFDYYDTLQDAFYRRGMDPTATSTFAAVARELTMDDGFVELFETPELEKETRDDFDVAKEMGVHGFPSVLVRHEGSVEGVTRGWLPPDLLREALAAWLPESPA